MGVTQYIGARYVPKFFENSATQDSTWSANTAYEPLTIVTYNGNSYTSKKMVPAGVGNPSSNPEYWASTGMYNAQVEEIRQEIEEVKDTLSTVAPAYMVWIGDSYSTETYRHNSDNMPIDLIPAATGCILKNYARNSAGFVAVESDRTFLSQMQLAVADTSYDHDQVKYVIVFGGNNDAYNLDDVSGATPTTVYNNGISTFTLAKTEFPNARIILIGINSAKRLTAPVSKSSPRTGNAWSVQNCEALYKQIATDSGVAFMNVSDCNLYMTSHFAEDGHPTDAGYKELSSAILSGLNGTPYTQARMCPALNNYNSVEETLAWTVETNSETMTASVDTNGSSIREGHFAGRIRVLVNNVEPDGQVMINIPGNLYAPAGIEPLIIVESNRNLLPVNVAVISSTQTVTGIRVTFSHTQTVQASQYLSIRFDIPLFI